MCVWRENRLLVSKDKQPVCRFMGYWISDSTALILSGDFLKKNIKI